MTVLEQRFLEILPRALGSIGKSLETLVEIEKERLAQEKANAKKLDKIIELAKGDD